MGGIFFPLGWTSLTLGGLDRGLFPRGDFVSVLFFGENPFSQRCSWKVPVFPRFGGLTTRVVLSSLGVLTGYKNLPAHFVGTHPRGDIMSVHEYNRMVERHLRGGPTRGFAALGDLSDMSHRPGV